MKTQDQLYKEETGTVLSDGIIPMLKKTLEYYETYIFPEAIEILKHDQLDSSDYYHVLYNIFWDDAQYRSCVSFPLISQMVDTFVSNLYDTDTKTRAVAFKQEDQENTAMAQDFYDWAYDSSNAEDVKETLKREACLLWTSYAHIRYDNWEKEMIYTKDWDTELLVRKISQPIVENISFFSLFLPPNTKDFYKSKWYAYRYIETKKSIKERYKWINIKFEDKDFSWSPLSTYDYDRAYHIKSYWDNLVNRIRCWLVAYNNTNDFVNKSLFMIDMKDNEFCEVIEYHEWDQITVIINWKQKWSWYSWNVWWSPFAVVTYDKQPWNFMGRWIWQKILTFQREAIQITNCIKDVTNQWLYPSFTAIKWSVKDQTGRTPAKMYWIPWKIYELTNNIWNAWLTPIEFSNPQYIAAWQNRLSWLLNQAQEVIWLNSYVTWWQSKVERSSAWVQQRIAVMRSRLQPIISSLNKFDSRLFECRLAQATVFMDNTFKVRVVWKDWADRWSKIRLSDILNKFDIIVDNEATRALTKNLRSTQALDALNKLYQINTDQITWLPIFDLTPAYHYIAENFDFPVISEMTAEQLQEKMNMKAEYDKIINPNEQHIAQDQTLQTPQEQVPYTPQYIEQLLAQWWEQASVDEQMSQLSWVGSLFR